MPKPEIGQDEAQRALAEVTAIIIRAAPFVETKGGSFVRGLLNATPSELAAQIIAALRAEPVRAAEYKAAEFRAKLLSKAEEQVAYWRTRMAAEKTQEDGLNEDGMTYTPIGDEAAWKGGYCNGRLSEADWWHSTIKYDAAIRALPAEQKRGGSDG